MLFNTLTFLVFFVAVLLLHWSLSKRMQKPLLLLTSYAFYSFWDWRFLFLIILVTLANFYLTQSIFRMPISRKKNILFLTLTFNLLVLGVFKYFDFFIESLNSLLNALGVAPYPNTIEIILPLGISFFTFKAISYAVDVYRKELEPTDSLIDFGIFLSYFPYMLAGPIMSAKIVLPQLRAIPTRLSSATVNSALLLIALGFFRKTVIGDYAAPLVDRIFGNSTQFDWKSLLIGVFAFSFQIYGDFAGYTDMARGISRLLGIELIRNFREPYLSRNITSFWRHWHISLSTWFKNYLYIPLGGNRVHFYRSALNLMLVMTIAGLWHGAAVIFLVWGMFHGFLLVAHKMWIRSTSKLMLIKNLHIPIIFKICGTFTLVTLGWIFFRADSLQSAIELIDRILRRSTGAFDQIDLLQLLILIVTSFTLDLTVRIYRKSNYVLGVFSSGLVIGLLLTMALVFRASEIIPFVYFQF